MTMYFTTSDLFYNYGACVAGNTYYRYTRWLDQFYWYWFQREDRYRYVINNLSFDTAFDDFVLSGINSLKGEFRKPNVYLDYYNNFIPLLMENIHHKYFKIKEFNSYLDEKGL